MSSAVFEKNYQPVIDGLSSFLDGSTGNALEIGSGTGQHILAFARAFPSLTWTPSDYDQVHLKSIDAWRRFAQADTRQAIYLDAASDWAKRPEVSALSPLKLILSMNVIHISPFTVTEGLINGAARTLDKGGFLAFYGPFREEGEHTGDGNARFDKALRADNPEWGVRDTGEITDLGKTSGLTFSALLKMPANNRILVLKKA